MSAEDPGFNKAEMILQSQSSSIALLIGNGINLACGQKRSISWNDLLGELIERSSRSASKNTFTNNLKLLLERDSRDLTPASLPEAFDIIKATCMMSADNLPKDRFQEIIAGLLRKMEPDAPHKRLIVWAQQSNVPVLTTNYDHCFQYALDGKCKRKRFGLLKPMSQYYPWDRYYASKAIIEPMHEFAIWHIHGDCEIRQSIRAGLDQYMGMVERLRAIKGTVAVESLNTQKDISESVPAFHKAPWLKIFMGKKLWIQGLALQPDEVAIRWLLIERFRYWSKYLPDSCRESGWYIHGPTDITGKIDRNRKIFLESVGIKVLEIKRPLNDYVNLYSIGINASNQFSKDSQRACT